MPAHSTPRIMHVQGRNFMGPSFVSGIEYTPNHSSEAVKLPWQSPSLPCVGRMGDLWHVAAQALSRRPAFIGSSGSAPSTCAHHPSAYSRADVDMESHLRALVKWTGHSAEQQYVHLQSALWFFEWILRITRQSLPGRMR